MSSETEQPNPSGGPTAGEQSIERILTLTKDAGSTIYAPSDDSFLMIEAIKTLDVNGKKILDVGTGSGILGLYCAMRGGKVTAADIDPLAIHTVGEIAQRLEVQVNLVVSDLFSKIPDRFDLILFNPPYLPSTKFEDRAVDGGVKGVSVSDAFLEALPRHLERGGQALLLLSSLNDPASIQSRHKKLQFSAVAKRSIFFEELLVLLVRPRDDLPIQ